MKKIIQLATIALNGAFIGGMLLIGLVLAPFWISTQEQLFLDWFSTYGNSIGLIMIPMGPGVLLLALASLILSKGNRTLWALTITLTLANILYFPLYFLPTNTSFVDQTIDISVVKNELGVWLSYHWQRIFFAVAALMTSILAVSRSK